MANSLLRKKIGVVMMAIAKFQKTNAGLEHRGRVYKKDEISHDDLCLLMAMNGIGSDERTINKYIKYMKSFKLIIPINQYAYKVQAQSTIMDFYEVSP